MAKAATLWGKEHYGAWMDLADALRSGRAVFEDNYGEPFFEWLATQPADLETYHKALSSYARHDYASLNRVVDFSRHRTVLDAGGGYGELLFSLLRENPQLEGILLDRPEVIARVSVPQGLEPRCHLVAGDLVAPGRRRLTPWFLPASFTTGGTTRR